MNQALYAHMNNKRKKKKHKLSHFPIGSFLGLVAKSFGTVVADHFLPITMVLSSDLFCEFPAPEPGISYFSFVTCFCLVKNVIWSKKNEADHCYCVG
jgi:hypothetical protein